MRIEQFFLEGLGHQSYLIVDDSIVDDSAKIAAVVDPRRDIEIYLRAASAASAQIAYIFETHIHNDYISGARELEARTGATIVNAASAELEYAYRAVSDGDRIAVGALSVLALATPGHTPDHVSYVVYEPGQAIPAAVFTGGSMLVGGAGRTDLVSPGMTLTLTRQQYHSLRRLLDSLPENALVYPTHGAGSFCSATTNATPARHSTIGQERLASPAVHAPDEAAFVRQQLADYGVYPAYYTYMGDINQRGPRILGTWPTLAPLAPETVRRHMNHGTPLVDARARGAFAREHIPGALNIELDESFGSYVGWLLPFNKPLMLLVEDDEGRHEASAQLIRIGFEQLRGYLEGGVAAWKAAGLPTNSFAAISIDDLYARWQRGEALAVLDVRDDKEWDSGHIPGSQHIHIGDLPRRLHEIPRESPVVTICRSGHRAEMAASIVAALGIPTLAVQHGGVPSWIKKGLPADDGAGPRVEAEAHNLGHAHP